MTLSVRKPDFKRIIPKVEPKKRTRLCALKSCRKPFLKQSSWHIACSTDCAIAVVAEKRKSNERKERQKGLKSIQKRSDCMEETKKAMHAYIRARDEGKKCISCDTVLVKLGRVGGDYDAGHFRSVGSASHMRFVENNIHGQCKYCNDRLKGNQLEYERRLRIRYGDDYVDEIKADNTTRKLTIDDLRAIRDHYKLKLKEIKNGNK